MLSWLRAHMVKSDRSPFLILTLICVLKSFCLQLQNGDDINIYFTAQL